MFSTLAYGLGDAAGPRAVRGLEALALSAEWYRAVVEFAQGAPGWLRAVAELGTDAGLLLFAGLFLAAWWRARRYDARSVALAVLGPFATVGPYLVSEGAKTLFDERRPCRAVAEGLTTIAHCPPVGDWSFPSNHATIAAAAAAALVVAWRQLAFVVLPWAALIALSRVFVGAHYPHDVAAGLLLGATVAPLLVLAVAGPLTSLVARLREHHVLRPALAASGGHR